jgi:hypothetical protein
MIFEVDWTIAALRRKAPSMHHPALCWCSLALATLLLAGCGHKPAADIPEVGKVELQDLWEMYSTYAAQTGKPPAKAEDLKAQARGSPIGGRSLSDHDFVILFGTPVGGANVLAFHKDVPVQGGLVLMSDGTIKTLSAAEFTGAPKAGK